MLNPAARQRQFENIAAARQRYQAAYQVYDALPHTPAEAELWKKSASAWQAWEKSNEKFFQSLPDSAEGSRQGETPRENRLLETCRRQQDQADNLTNQLIRLQAGISARIVRQSQAEGAASIGMLFTAIVLGTDGKAEVNPALCHGCGSCTAACPSGAITALHFTDEEIVAQIDGLLAELV